MADVSSEGAAEPVVEKYETAPPLKKPKQSSSCGCGGGGCGGCAPPVQKEEEEEEVVHQSVDGYDSEEAYCPRGVKKMDRKTWRKYLQQIADSDGFDIYDFPGHCPMVSIVPFEDFKLAPPWQAAELNGLATKALHKFNSEHNEDYEFVKIEKINGQLVAGYIYYITFQARKAGADANDESTLVTFQTRIWDAIPPSELEIYFCRIKALS